MCCILCVAAVLAASGVSCDNGHGSKDASNNANAPYPAISLDSPVFNEINKDNIVYSGTASNAEYYDNNRTATITNPKLNGILKDGEPFSATSDSAFYNENKHLITLKNNIYANLNNDYDMRCNTMDYLIDKKTLVANEPITVTGRDLQLHADRGSIELEDNRLTMQGNINAKIYNMSLK